MKRLIRRVVSRFEDVVAEGLVKYEPLARAHTADRAAELVRGMIGNEAVEVFVALTLDSKNRVTGAFEVSRGTLTASLVHPREVFGPALRIGNVAALIVAHNHPSGDPTPSEEDIEITKRLREGGALLGISVLDHIVIGAEGRFVSIRNTHLHLFRSPL